MRAHSFLLVLALPFVALVDREARGSKPHLIPEGVGVRLGMGFNEATDETRGSCLEDPMPLHSPDSSQTLEVTQKIITSNEELRSMLDVSASASIGVGAFSGSATTSYANSRAINRFHTFVVISAKVRNAAQLINKARIRPDALALWSSDQSRFVERCGDSYVDSMTTGGMLVSVLEISTVSQEDRRSVSVALEGGSVFAKGKAAAKSSLDSLSKRFTLKWTLLRQGAVENVPNYDAVEESLRTFPKAVSIDGGKPWAYSFTTKSYVTADNAPTSISTDWNQRDTLERIGERITTANAALADLDFVASNHDRFVQFDATALSNRKVALETYIEKLRGLGKDCHRNAKKCNHGAIPQPLSEEPLPALKPVAEPQEPPYKQLCADWKSTQQNVDWVLFRDKGAKRRYLKCRGSNHPKFSCVWAAQGHNKGVQKQFRKCIAAVELYLNKLGERAP